MLRRILLLALLALLPVAAEAAGPPREGDMSIFTVEDTPAPFPAFRFRTLDGAEKTMADFKGRLVLLNIWASWCGPCVDEMPSLDALAAAYPSDKLTIIALSVDRGGARAVKGFLDKVPLETLVPYLETDFTLQRAVRMVGLPTSYLIDGEGRKLGSFLGPADWNSPEARKLMDWYLAKPAAPKPARATPTGMPALPSPDSIKAPSIREAQQQTPTAIDPMVWAMFDAACGKRCRKDETEFK